MVMKISPQAIAYLKNNPLRTAHAISGYSILEAADCDQIVTNSFKSSFYKANKINIRLTIFRAIQFC